MKDHPFELNTSKYNPGAKQEEAEEESKTETKEESKDQGEKK